MTSIATYRVVAQSDKRVEIAMSSADPAVLPFAVDVRMPDGLTIQQPRYAVAAGDPSFTAFVVDDRRVVRSWCRGSSVPGR